MRCVASPTIVAPLRRLASIVTVRSFASPCPMFVTLVKTLNRSPLRTVAGTVNVMSKYGLRTSTPPVAWPVTVTGPVGSPSSVAAMSKFRLWKPSRSPRIRNSACPCSPGRDATSSTSRAVVADAADEHRERLNAVRRFGERQRIVAGADDVILAGRELHRPAHVAHREIRERRRAVGDEELRREELFQVADVPGNDEDAGNPDLLLLSVGHLHRDRLGGRSISGTISGKTGMSCSSRRHRRLRR